MRGLIYSLLLVSGLGLVACQGPTGFERGPDGFIAGLHGDDDRDGYVKMRTTATGGAAASGASGAGG